MNLNNETKFFNALEDIFIGTKVEGKSGYANLMNIKSNYFNYIKEELMDTINNELKIIPEFREELFDKLYTFFKRYFNESGSIYFSSTPYQNRVYDKIYTENQDMVLFWKTNMLYYVKTDMLFENLMVETSGLKFLIDTEDIEHKKSNEKRNLVFKFDKINPVKNEIILKVSYSVRNTKTKMPELIKELTKELGKGVVSEEILNSVFRTFRKQSEVDYFINKNAKEFLKEQFDLWIYQYMFKDITEFSSNRIKQLQVIKSISYKIIDFIAQFEDELVKIWRKPKFILNSNYVISYDKLADNKELIGKILMHGGITSQIEEWKELSLVEKDFSTENINDIKNFHLPFDTKYFKTLESEIISKFENLDDQIDGWMINSENFQALNTIKNKYKGQVKCIYIDPPFNLNSTDRFLYRTNYKDANWATLLENRLELAKELLHEDGLIFVRCDYHGSHIVKMILEKIFGNMKSEIIIERSRNEAGSPNKLETVNEWLYMFGKSEAPIQKVKTERSIANIKWTSFLMAGDRKPPQRTFLGKTLYPPKGQHFSLIQEKVDRLLTDHFLRLKCKDCGTYYFKADSTEELNVKMKTKKNRFKFYDIKTETNIVGTNKIDHCINCQADNFEVNYIGSNEVYVNNNWLDIPSYANTHSFQTENSEQLLERVISFVKEGYVLDFFAGSATTQATAQKLGVKWLGVELGEHFNDVDLPRLKRVISGKDKTGITKTGKYNSGGMFKYSEMEQYEDVLRNTKQIYSDTDFNLLNSNQSIYEQYIFQQDLKFTSAVTIDDSDIKINLESLYENIDLTETLSCLTGKKIISIKDGTAKLDGGLVIDLDNPDYKLLKPLIWW